MKRAVRDLFLLAAAVLAGCTTAPDLSEAEGVAERPTTSVSGFGGPELTGLCEDANVLVTEAEPAAPTPAAAVDEFVEMNPVLADTRIDGTEILHDNDVVGHVRISEAPGGGYYVETAEWCYPE